MATRRRPTTITSRRFRIPLVAVAFFALLPGALTIARGADGALSETDKKCLVCHSSEGLVKELPDGQKLSLQIPGSAFAASVHNPLGCAACHSDINPGSHPPSTKKIGSTRDYTLAMTQVCRSCHEDKFKLYEGSIHATLVREGNPIAPVCTDCHNPHSVLHGGARESITAVPCRKCHEPIFEAYAASVHGRARSEPGGKNAPICADCHRAHDVSAASAGNRLKNACLGCHKNTVAAHQKWLPNTERHLETVSCPACHSPGARRRVDLRLYDTASQSRVMEKEGVPLFENRVHSVDAKGNGLDAIALRSLLREFNREGTPGKTTLRGRLEVQTGVEAHQLADKSKAIRNCDSCHRAGADPFQSVTVSIVGPDGRPVRYGAHKEVLNSVISADSMGGFYAIGGTRIRLLDVLLALAFLAGVGVPAGHMTLRWLVGRHLRKAEQEAAMRQAQGPSAPGSHPGTGDAPN